MHKSLSCIACYIGLVFAYISPDTCTTILFLSNEYCYCIYVRLSSDFRCQCNPSLGMRCCKYTVIFQYHFLFTKIFSVPPAEDLMRKNSSVTTHSYSHSHHIYEAFV